MRGGEKGTERRNVRQEEGKAYAVTEDVSDHREYLPDYAKIGWKNKKHMDVTRPYKELMRSAASLKLPIHVHSAPAA